MYVQNITEFNVFCRNLLEIINTNKDKLTKGIELLSEIEPLNKIDYFNWRKAESLMVDLILELNSKVGLRFDKLDYEFLAYCFVLSLARGISNALDDGQYPEYNRVDVLRLKCYINNNKINEIVFEGIQQVAISEAAKLYITEEGDLI